MTASRDDDEQQHRRELAAAQAERDERRARERAFLEAERGMFAAERMLRELIADRRALLEERDRAATAFAAFQAEVRTQLSHLRADVDRLLKLVRDGANGAQRSLLERVASLEEWRQRHGIEAGARSEAIEELRHEFAEKIETERTAQLERFEHADRERARIEEEAKKTRASRRFELGRSIVTALVSAIIGGIISAVLRRGGTP